MIREYYLDFANTLILLSFLIMIVGLYNGVLQHKKRKVAISILAFLLIIAIGESNDIAHAFFDSWIPIGWLNALFLVIGSFFIALSTVKYIDSKFSYCLLVPCFLVLFIFIYNLQYQQMGLHILGTWIS